MRRFDLCVLAFLCVAMAATCAAQDGCGKVYDSSSYVYSFTVSGVGGGIGGNNPPAVSRVNRDWLVPYVASGWFREAPRDARGNPLGWAAVIYYDQKRGVNILRFDDPGRTTVLYECPCFDHDAKVGVFSIIDSAKRGAGWPREITVAHQ